MQSSKVVRNVRIFRYDPVKGGEGTFQSYQLTIDNPETTTILDVLLRIQKEQDPSISFRFACRVNMCGSCGMVINGREGLACKTNVCDLPANQDITLRPLNHFPVIKDLLVDMGPFQVRRRAALLRTGGKTHRAVRHQAGHPRTGGHRHGHRLHRLWLLCLKLYHGGQP